MQKFLPAGMALLLTVAAPASAQSIAAGVRNAVPASQISRVPVARRLRIEENIATAIPLWTGVRTCSRATRARTAFMAEFDRWVGRQIRQHPSRRYRHLRSGWRPLTSSHRNSTGPWPDRKRSCRGGFNSARVFIEFQRR